MKGADIPREQIEAGLEAEQDRLSKVATPPSVLRDRIMNPNVAKSESEWWAREEIERLQHRLDDLGLLGLTSPPEHKGDPEDVERFVDMLFTTDISRETAAALVLMAIADERQKREAVGARLARAAEVLTWYEDQARNCRKLGGIPEGEAARHALSSDGGKRARDFLSASSPPADPVAQIAARETEMDRVKARLQNAREELRGAGFNQVLLDIARLEAGYDRLLAEVAAHERSLEGQRRRWKSADEHKTLDAVRQQIAGLIPSAAEAIADMQGRIIAAEEENETLRARTTIWRNEATVKLRLLEAAEARLAQAAAALEPFAEFQPLYDNTPAFEADDAILVYGGGRLTVGDLRAARNFLAEVASSPPVDPVAQIVAMLRRWAARADEQGALWSDGPRLLGIAEAIERGDWRQPAAGAAAEAQVRREEDA